MDVQCSRYSPKKNIIIHLDLCFWPFGKWKSNIDCLLPHQLVANFVCLVLST